MRALLAAALALLLTACADPGPDATGLGQAYDIVRAAERR